MDRDGVAQQSITFLAPGAGFVEGSFSMDPGVGRTGGRQEAEFMP